LVLQWRDHAHEPLRLLKIRNFCSDPVSRQTDAYYTTDAMAFNLDPAASNSGYFKKFHTIILAGDHGSHFTANNIFYDQSTWYRKWNVKVSLYFFCSYHAFGMADAAGSEDKKSGDHTTLSID